MIIYDVKRRLQIREIVQRQTNHKFFRLHFLVSAGSCRSLTFFVGFETVANQVLIFQYNNQRPRHHPMHLISVGNLFVTHLLHLQGIAEPASMCKNQKI